MKYWVIEGGCCLGAVLFLWLGRNLHPGFYWGALFTLTGWLLYRLGTEVAETRPAAAGLVVPGSVFVACVWLLPDLSTDYHRYLWEGFVQNQGYSPYLYAPETLFAQLDHPSEPFINHADLTAVYPPLAQYFFRLVNWFTLSAYGWKVLLVLSVLPLWFLGRNGGATRWLLFSPVVLFEGIWNGHLDLLGLLPAVLLVDALRRSLPARAGLLLGYLAALKIIPIMLLPFCILHFKGRAKAVFLALLAAVVVLCYLPYWPQLPHLFESFVTYSKEWSFNNPLYHLLVTSMAADTARKVLGLAFLLALAAAFFYKQDVVWRCSAAWVALYVFSPTLFPWYLLWLVAFTETKQQPFIHLAYAAAFFSYLVLIPFRQTGLWQDRFYWMIPEWIALLFCFYRILFPRPIQAPPYANSEQCAAA